VARFHPKVKRTLQSYSTGGLGDALNHKASWIAIAVAALDRKHSQVFVESRHPRAADNKTVFYSTKKDNLLVAVSLSNRLFKASLFVKEHEPHWAPKIIKIRKTPLNLPEDEETRDVIFVTLEKCKQLEKGERRLLTSFLNKYRLKVSMELPPLSSKHKIVADVYRVLDCLHSSGFFLCKMKASYFARREDGSLVLLGLASWKKIPLLLEDFDYDGF
jgi:hypothetical protein